MALNKEKQKKKWKIACIVVFAVSVLAMIQKNGFISRALFDSSQAVQIDPDTIENSTLIIGTHLIYLHALNDEIYQIATQSASDAGQDRIYYKSEMADGIWYDITDAGSIRDITSDGEMVDHAVLQSLYITHHTKSDGITYDLTTNQAICIFDIYPIYDLESMPELESLKMQYDMMKESKSETDTAIRNLELTQNFFTTTVETNEATEYGKQIEALQAYYEELTTNDAAMTETEGVLDIMEKLDYARKASVFSIVETALGNLQDMVADTSAAESDDLELTLDDALLTAIGNAQSAIAESITEAQGNMLAQGDTILVNTEYDLAQNLIAAARAGNFASCDEANAKLIDLKHITEGVVSKRDTELVLIDEMIAAADQKYQEELSVGESVTYQGKVAENASHAALNNILKQDLGTVNAIRSELQFLIQSKTDRQENTLAQSFILVRIEQSSLLLRQIPNDSYMDAMKGTVDTYVSWLQELLAKVKKNSGVQTQTDDLYEKKASLQEQQLAALDDLNLDTAKKIEAQISAVDDEIAALETSAENNLTSLLNQKNALEKDIDNHPTDENLKQQLASINAEIANASTDMSDGSAATNIMQMKNEAMNYVKEGDASTSAMEALQTCIDGLSSMLDSGSTLALASMKEIYQQMVSVSYLADEDAYDDLIQGMEETLENTEVVEALDSTLSASEALEILEENLQTDLTGNAEENLLTDADCSALLIALSDYYDETGNEDIKSLLEGQLNRAKEQGKGYVFDTYRNQQETFVPAETLAKYIGYRYLWNDTKKTAILSRGPVFYIFQTFYSIVQREGGKEEDMDIEAAYQGRIYLPQSYISKQFDCQVIDISGTNNSVLVNDTVIEKSQELCSELLEKGGN